MFAKVLESFVGNWIVIPLTDSFVNNQFGSLKGRSTTHALISILHTWQTALDKSDSVSALFIDYSKAFDRVNHNILLNKLHSR